MTTRFRAPLCFTAVSQSPFQTPAQDHLRLFKKHLAHLYFMLQLCFTDIMGEFKQGIYAQSIGHDDLCYHKHRQVPNRYIYPISHTKFWFAYGIFFRQFLTMFHVCLPTPALKYLEKLLKNRPFLRFEHGFHIRKANILSTRLRARTHLHACIHTYMDKPLLDFKI